MDESVRLVIELENSGLPLTHRSWVFARLSGCEMSFISGVTMGRALDPCGRA